MSIIKLEFCEQSAGNTASGLHKNWVMAESNVEYFMKEKKTKMRFENYH